MACPKLYLSPVPPLAFCLWLDSPRGSRPPHFRRFAITLRRVIHGTTLYANRQRVHYQFLNSLATKSQQVKLRCVQLYSLPEILITSSDNLIFIKV
jgi:uncharacterized protein (UPF0147 family)